MAAAAQSAKDLLRVPALPRIIFVLGKGGVGRSTVAAALGLARARRGERVLILQWAIADAIGPWFGKPAAGATPVDIAPGLATANFALDEALRAYFVDHLHVGLVYRAVIRARAVTRLLDVAPGLAEMFFLGELWWLTTLARREAGMNVDRIIVDAPATGHGASLLDVPAILAGMPASGLLSLETGRVADMMADPTQTGSIVVALAEPLVVDETFELVPRLPRPPLALLVNRSVAGIAGGELEALRVSPRSRRALAAVHDELRAREALERELAARAPCPAAALRELPGLAAIDVVRACAEVL